ncbi:metallo-beta-lactamase superfamily protein [Coprinopsis sp. MPI-PUGE-AT-0042]|nr:metallo-beta-lactamase superfamily protein [Coprinopsis sp. MPI-PUGE-AT-0042]
MSPPALKRVSRLSVTFLVDNTIEWMSKLPPGFTHELPFHVPQAPPDEKMGVPVLNFDDFCCGAHGFAALLETEVAKEAVDSILNPGNIHRTLFDTGPDSQSLVRNLRGMQVPITAIDRVVTSHWHADHTGGLLSFLELRNECERKGIATPRGEYSKGTSSTEELGVEVTDIRPCVVDVHPSRPLARGIAPNGGAVLCAIPLDPTFDEITARGGLLETHDEGHLVAGDTVYISGEIPRVTDFEGGLLSGVRWVEGSDGNGKWEEEPQLMDERYAAVDVIGKGLVIFSSCSHAGIVNVVKDAVKTFGRPIYMIAGGLHLASSDHHYRIGPTVDFLSKSLRPAPTYILPMHCTGWKAKVALEKELGEAIVPAGVGHKVDIIASEELGERVTAEIVEAI